MNSFFRPTAIVCLSWLGALSLCSLFATSPADSNSPPSFDLLAKHSFELRLANVDAKWERLNRVHDGSKQYFSIEYSSVISQHYRMHSWLSWGYSTKNGKSTVAGYSSRYHYMPLGLGIKHTVPLTPKLDLCLGVGALLSFLKIRSNTEYVDSPICRWAQGAIFKAELQYKISSSTFIGGFIDMIDQRFTMKTDPEQGDSNVIDFNSTNYGIMLGWTW
jgi:hypothetical protein